MVQEDVAAIDTFSTDLCLQFNDNEKYVLMRNIFKNIMKLLLSFFCVILLVEHGAQAKKCFIIGLSRVADMQSVSFSAYW